MDIADLLDFQELLFDQIIARPEYPLILRKDTPPPDEINIGQMPVAIYPIFSDEPVDDDVAHLNIQTLSLWRADTDGWMRLIVRDAEKLESISLADINGLAKITVFLYIAGPGYGILRDDLMLLGKDTGK